MGEITATATQKDKDGNKQGEIEGSLEFDFGADLKSAVKLYGEDVIFNMYRQAGTIALQGRMRAYLANMENDPKGLAEALKDWKPGVSTRVKKSPAEKLAEMFSGMSPEEISAAIKEAQGKAKAA